jgi:hypothetical protein
MVARRQRPFGVGFLSILLIAMGLLQIGSGILFLVGRNDDDVLDAVDASSGDVTAIGVAAIVGGVLVVLVASALRGGANWARLFIGIIAALNVIGLIWAVAAYHQLHWYDVAWPTLVYAFVAGYLFFDDDAKAYFA